MSSKVFIPKYGSHKICQDFFLRIKTDIYSARNENANITLAFGFCFVCGYEIQNVPI